MLRSASKKLPQLPMGSPEGEVFHRASTEGEDDGREAFHIEGGKVAAKRLQRMMIL